VGIGHAIESTVENLVLAFHRRRLGADFGTFHIGQQRARRWPNVRNAYWDLLVALMDTTSVAGAKALLTIDSRRALVGSPGFIKPDILAAMTQIAPYATDDQVTALGGMTELAWWVGRRAKFLGGRGERLVVLADQRGSSLSRAGERYTISNGGPALVGMTRSEVISTFAAAVATLPGIADDSAPEIGSIRTVQSERFYAIQACDLLAGLGLAAVRAISGSGREIDHDKMSMLEHWVDLTDAKARFPGHFVWDGNEVRPHDQRDKFHIELELRRIAQ
jgi:hypothetical protein